MLGDSLKILEKDLRLELRSKFVLNSAILFALITTFLFSAITREFSSEMLSFVSSGIFWLVVIFSSVLGTNQVFSREKDLGTLDGLLLSPISRTSILIGKILFNCILVTIVELAIIPLFVGMMNVYPACGPANLVAIALIGGWCFSVISSAIAILMMYSKARELLLPVVLFPLLIPLLIALVSATRDAFVYGYGVLDLAGALAIPILYALITLIVSSLTVGVVLEE